MVCLTDVFCYDIDVNVLCAVWKLRLFVLCSVWHGHTWWMCSLIQHWFWHWTNCSLFWQCVFSVLPHTDRFILCSDTLCVLCCLTLSGLTDVFSILRLVWMFLAVWNWVLFPVLTLFCLAPTGLMDVWCQWGKESTRVLKPPLDTRSTTTSSLSTKPARYAWSTSSKCSSSSSDLEKTHPRIAVFQASEAWADFLCSSCGQTF